MEVGRGDLNVPTEPCSFPLPVGILATAFSPEWRGSHFEGRFVFLDVEDLCSHPTKNERQKEMQNFRWRCTTFILDLRVFPAPRPAEKSRALGEQRRAGLGGDGVGCAEVGRGGGGQRMRRAAGAEGRGLSPGRTALACTSSPRWVTAKCSAKQK